MQTDKTQASSERIYDLITSLWGSRIIGGLFVLIAGWAMADEIIGLFQ